MTTYYKSEKAGESAEAFGLGLTQRELANGKEYQLFVHVVDMLNEACFKGMDRRNSLYTSAVPFIRRFGKRDFFYLKTEEMKTEGFPDFFVVREDVICIADHFQIDSSPKRERSGNNGTEYLALLGRNKGDVCCAQGAEEYSEIFFSSDNLRASVRSMMKKKARSIDRYVSAVKDCIARKGPSFVKVDGVKPMELWLLIEDVSPESGRYTDAAIAQIASCLDEYTSVTGVIYVYCGYPKRLPAAVSDIRLAVQGDIMREDG